MTDRDGSEPRPDDESNDRSIGQPEFTSAATGLSDRDSLIAKLLLRDRLVDAALLARAQAEVADQPDGSLLDLLVYRGYLSSGLRECIDGIASELLHRVELTPESTRALDDTESFSVEPQWSVQAHGRFGDYEIIEEIAKGGMGVVYKSRQVKLNRIVALKMIRSGEFANEEQVKRFYKEAEAAAKLDHPGIVPVYEVGQTAGLHFYSMAFVEGQSLAGRISESPLEAREAADLLIKIARAVAYAHENGVIHRDLKPGNVLLDTSGEPRVTDFGLAKQQAGDSVMTATGQILGTPSYMPPEQASGKADDVDQRADVYALGAILYATLTGRPPFQAASPMETLIQVMERDPVSVRQLVPGAPRDLETICLKCLHKEADRRYESCKELAGDLHRWLNGEPIVARRVGRAERAWKWCKRKPIIVGSITTVLGLLVVGSLILWERLNASHADGLVQSLLKANTSQVNDIVEEIDNYRYWADPQLNDAFEASSEDSEAKLHVGMALLASNSVARDYANDRLLEVSPGQFAHVRDALKNHVTRKRIDQLWRIVDDQERDGAYRFQAACALATFDSQNDQWTDPALRQFVSEHLVGVLPSALTPWRNALRPVKEHLTEALGTIFRDDAAGEQVKVFTVESLADYLSDDVDALFDLLADSDGSQFPVIYGMLSRFPERAIAMGKAEISKPPAESGAAESDEPLAIRKANAAAMLFKLGAHEQVWPLLAHSPDPRVRSYLIHRLSPLKCDPKLLIDRYEVESDVTIKSALLLCLGEFEALPIPTARIDRFTEKLLNDYRDHQDAGLHAAVEWLLLQWNQADAVDSVVNELMQSEGQLKAAGGNQKRWYVNGQGQTFVLLDADEFLMGSPITDVEHNNDELLHRRRIGRRIAVSTKEVTTGQFHEFEKGQPNVIGVDNPSLSEFIHTETSPMIGITWYEAAWYCNWLSEQEGIPEHQWCYEPNMSGEYAVGMRAKENFWELTGYRLPTEAEWEYACRGGCTTSRHYGDSDALLVHYAWFGENGNERVWDVGTRKPNDFGIFDTHGNVDEWCFDGFMEYPSDGTTVLDDFPAALEVQDTEGRVTRGGSLADHAVVLRSAFRDLQLPLARSHTLGFRVVRTFPTAP